MNSRQEIYKKLETLILNESELHETYTKILIQERETLTQFSTEKMNKLSLERERWSALIEEAHHTRIDFMAEFPDGAKMRLSQFIVRFCHPSDAKQLAPLVARLRKAASESHSKSFEFRQLLEYSQKLIGGTMSIIWSATQNVNRLYTRAGAIKESFNYTTKHQGVLKEV